jgi:uncharacterized membrane protein
MLILMAMFLFSGALLAGLAVPMIMKKIPPNGFYGFRVKKTMENPETWYLVNVYSGKWLLVTGIVLEIAATGFYFIPGITLDGYAYANLAVWGLAFAGALIASIRYLNSL